ncbi:MAG: hypothetical protein JWQ43_3585 [Glaciihabitans sp.]|nr:hypothetical protein [Glaciihabitans sp.]
MNPRRLRLITILAIPLFAALTLLSVTQRWWTVAVPDRALEVVGTTASPALSALALSSFALAAALAISGPVFRVILGILQLLIGATVVFGAVVSVTDPVSTSSTLITDATGVAGTESVASLVESVTMTGWPWLAIVSGALSALVGILLLVTSRRWPVASRKYQPVRLEGAEADPSAPRDSVGDWDALSDGSDPTDR